MNGRPPFLQHLLSQGFELVETHISWVLLGAKDVYKIKKEVDFGFLDFSTPELRRKACEAEVRLNQRLAPGVYLGVLPLTERGGSWHFGDPANAQELAEAAEWAVHMVRLPSSCRADHLLAAGKLGVVELEALAAKLASFHAATALENEKAAFGTPEVVRTNVVENFVQGRASLKRALRPAEARELEAWQLDFLEQKKAIFAARAEEGHVRDGHGDLRLEHVYLGAPDRAEVVVVDCIEFNERFRFADVTADIAFLAMDLTKHHRPDLAEQFLAAYARESDDFGLYALVDFYESYRAHVRAKIAGFAADDPGAGRDARLKAEEEARRYYLLALASERRPLLPPRLIAVGGQIASGKSTLASALARALGAPVIEADRTRKFLLGVAPEKPVHEMPWQGAYSPEWTRRVYGELRRRAETLLGSGRTAILDASFRKQEERMALKKLALDLGVPFLFAECRTDAATCKKRLEKRAHERGSSDGRLEIFDQLQAAWEPVRDLGAEEYRVLDSTKPPEEILAELLEILPTLPPALG